MMRGVKNIFGHFNDSQIKALIPKGDWQEDGTMLLWDQCKECGINECSL